MAVEVHVTGRIELGRFAEFVEAAKRWLDYRSVKGHESARILHGLSGQMNHVRFVFVYPDLAAYETEEGQDAVDPEYASIAAGMPFVDGTLEYAIYRKLDA